jgi:hypothetical protein
MAVPSCPNPAHAGSRVSRAGWYGTAPHRRQRWQCRPLNGAPPHRFTEVLTRQEAATSHCADCSSELDEWQGQSGARTYAFSARDIAHGLARVAQGDSYRRAAAHTRVVARRQHNRVRCYRKRGVRRVRRGDKDGQVVANWVDVFAPVVCWPFGHPTWPERMVVDSTSFVVQTGPPRRTLHLFAVVGYDPPRYQPKLWLVRPSPSKAQAVWEDFFDLLKGTPRHIMADMDATIEQAVDARFPRRRDRRRSTAGVSITSRGGSRAYSPRYRRRIPCGSSSTRRSPQFGAGTRSPPRSPPSTRPASPCRRRRAGFRRSGRASASRP